MPHTSSAKKSLRQTEKRRLRNRAVKKDLKLQLKKVLAAAKSGTPEVLRTEVNTANKKLDRAAAKRGGTPHHAAHPPAHPGATPSPPPAPRPPPRAARTPPRHDDPARGDPPASARQRAPHPLVGAVTPPLLQRPHHQQDVVVL